MGGVTGLSLVTGPFPWVLVGLLVGGLAHLLTAHRSRRWVTRGVPLAVLVAGLLLLTAEIAVNAWHPWPDALPWRVPFWVGLGLLGPTLAAVGWPRLRWWRRGVSVVAALVVVLGAANQVNAVFGAFPTVSTALGLTPANTLSAAQLDSRYPAVAAPVTAPAGGTLADVWTAPAHLPAHGVLVHIAIPARTSGISARRAWVYLPPAYLVRDRPLLPVLVLMGGQPGSPRDWLDGGQMAGVLDAYAAAHGGLAPVVVMPDALGGSETGNTLCADTDAGRADTYLSVDVPTWISRTLQVDPDHAHWAAGGFSFGGTCALQLGVAHPDVYASMIIISGQQEPTLGDRQQTVDDGFSGSDAAYDAADPVVELTHPQGLQDSAAFLAVGAQDDTFTPQAQTVRAALTGAGVPVDYQEYPGAHVWGVATAALAAALPWLAPRAGLSP